jgi:hypothetical protein
LSFSSIKFYQINQRFQLFKSIIHFLEFISLFFHLLYSIFIQIEFFIHQKHFRSKQNLFFSRISFFYSYFKLFYSIISFFLHFIYFWPIFTILFLFHSNFFILLQQNKTNLLQKHFSLLLIFISFSIYQILFSSFNNIQTTYVLFSFDILLTILFLQLNKLFCFFLNNISSSSHLSHFHYFIKTLKSLWLNNNQITDQGIKYLCNVLQNNKVKSNLLFISIIFIISWRHSLISGSTTIKSKMKELNIWVIFYKITK